MKNLKRFGPFLWVRLNCLKATKLLWGDSLLFTTESPGVSGTRLINFGRLKGWNNLDLEAIQQIWLQDSGLEIQCPKHLDNWEDLSYLESRCPVFINNKQTLDYKVAIE